MQSLWSDVIEPAIRATGYEPLRIDSKEHNGKIDDEIMASIRGARFVVSDFTGNRCGVYYEAGFAQDRLKNRILATLGQGPLQIQ